MLKKIRSYEEVGCSHPDHKPPMFQYFSPGEYVHVCDGCGDKTKFEVPLVTMGGGAVTMSGNTSGDYTVYKDENLTNFN